MDIIVFSGQSNMQGQSECLSDSSRIPGAYEYKFLTDSVVPLGNPVGEDIRFDRTEGYVFTAGVDLEIWHQDHIAGSACYGHTNLVPEFCRAYAETTGREVLAVHIAKGSTDIAFWMPGNPGYEILVEKATAAHKKVAAEHIFFVWLQGESDAIDGNSRQYYMDSLKRLCKALMQDVEIEKFGIIRVGRFTNDSRDDEIISAQDAICEEDSAFLLLTDIATELNRQTAYMNPRVKGHYSARGLEVLGAAAGKTLGTYASKEVCYK